MLVNLKMSTSLQNNDIRPTEFVQIPCTDNPGRRRLSGQTHVTILNFYFFHIFVDFEANL